MDQILVRFTLMNDPSLRLSIISAWLVTGRDDNKCWIMREQLSNWWKGWDPTLDSIHCTYDIHIIIHAILYWYPYLWNAIFIDFLSICCVDMSFQSNCLPISRCKKIVPYITMRFKYTFFAIFKFWYFNIVVTPRK